MKLVNALLIAGPALFAAPVFASEPPDPFKVEDGRQTYEEYCSACHGADMKNPVEGARNLRLFPNDEFDRWKEIVVNGKGDMPAWGDILTEEEYDRIWYYVASRAGEEAIPEQKAAPIGADSAEAVFLAALDHPTEPQPETIEKARRLYEQLCSHCHGVGLVTSGVSSYDLRKYPKDRYPEWKRSVKNGKGDMPAWGDILFPEEYALLWYYITTNGGKEPFPGFGAAADGTQQSSAAPPPELSENGTLKVCMARNGGAMSSARIGGGAGFDYGVVADLAQRLSLTLDVTWYESEGEELFNPLDQINAMLAYGLCDIAPAYPEHDKISRRPRQARAPLPYWTGRSKTWNIAQQFDLIDLELTRPYMRAALGVVLGPSAGKTDLTALDELQGLKVGVQQGTLAEAILARQAPSAIRKNIVTVSPGPKFLWDLEIGKFDAALVDVAAYDFHMRQNMISALKLAGWRHEIGMNISIAVPADRPGLLAALNSQIDAMLAAGRMDEIAAEQATHYAPPMPGGPHDLSRMVLSLGR